MLIGQQNIQREWSQELAEQSTGTKIFQRLTASLKKKKSNKDPQKHGDSSLPMKRKDSQVPR